MMRACLCLAFLACSSASSSKPVTPAPPPPSPAPPAAPVVTAEARFEAWLTAFNAGDKAGLTAFRDQLTPELAKAYPDADGMLGFRASVGGFDIKKPEEATPVRFAALLKERNGDQFARAVVELDAAQRVKTFSLEAIPTPDELRPARLTEAAAIEALRAELDRKAANDEFSGTVLVAKNGKPIFVQAYGLADRDKKVANTVGTRFRIGSMNKMFTAVATLQLVQAGKLRLDDPVGKHLPDYPNKDVASKVTIHHLLTHTGGTGDIFGPEYDAKRLELRTLEDYVKLYGQRALTHEPGAEMRYSNYGFLLLGVIIARVTKQTYYDRVEAAVFKKAKMASTSSPFEDKPATGRSIAYTKQGPDKRLPDWTPASDLPIRATSAGGGDSTVEDLLRFANALTGRQLLDAKHTELATTGKVDSRGGAKYAYGFSEGAIGGVRCIGHGGGAPGMNGDLQICDSGYTIAVLANMDPPAAGRVLQFIKDRLPAAP
jgi:D-alanyl-D-alanine carboxypeptidase